jgi:hypothetical protein
MPKPDDDGPLLAPAPVTPQTLPPDFLDISQNPSSELQRAPPPFATPNEVADATPVSVVSEVRGRRATPTGRHSTPV